MTVRYVVEAPGGVERDLLVAALWNAGAAGLWERDHRTVVAWFDEPVNGVPGDGRWEDEPDRDWLALWKAGLEPVTVGDLTVAPSWRTDGPSPTTVVIDPGMAFGTGHHATTRLCLRALRALGLRGRSVLDVGTGSGVLAIAARLLGADPVVGVDTDPDAVATAEANARRNRVTLDLRVGSTGATDVGASFDVVVANLITGIVLDLAPELLEHVAPDGALIVSGVSTSRADEVVDLLGGLTDAAPAVRVEGDWVAITVRR